MSSPQARGDIGTLFVSMATASPRGPDAEYLRWHTLDHRPEQHRLSAVRASLRLVSTPDVPGRADAGDERFDAIDHVMTYFFTDPAGIDRLPRAVHGARRRRPQARTATAGGARRIRRATQGGGTARQGRRRRAAVVAGARALPVARTRPRRQTPARRRRAWPGCGRRQSLDVDAKLASAPAGQTSPTASSTTTRCDAAHRLRPALEDRWATADVEPLLRRTVSPGRAAPVGSSCAIRFPSRRLACASA